MRSSYCSARIASVLVLGLGLGLGPACGDDATGASAGSTGSGSGSTAATEDATSQASASSSGSTGISGSHSGTESATGTSGSSSASASATDDPTVASATTGIDTTEPTTTETDTDTDTTGDTDTGSIVCPEGGLGPGDHVIEVEHGGLTRTIRLHVPPSYDGGDATPLVVNFHGLTSNPDQQILFSQMNPTADAEGFIVAYPAGHMSSWNAGACCGGAMDQEIDDVGFVRAFVEEIEGLACIDPARIYATGMSNGGFMTNRLACEASDLFAAFAPVSAVLVADPCEPARPVPIMMFNGTTDTLVAYQGGLFMGAVETFELWSEKGECLGDPQETFAEGAATCLTYSECADGAEVTLCTIDPMGHCWPGNAFCPFIPANTDISANEEMWAFFQAHPMP